MTDATIPARPTVSVVVPAYRAAATLSRTVAGLLEQTEAVLEIVIVSDGNVDDTPQIAAGLAAEHPNVRTIALPENRGVARARDAGVRTATGDFVLFADADDSMPAGAIQALVDRAVATDADVVIGSARALLPSGDDDFILRGPRDFSLVSRAFAFRLLLRGVITGHLWNKLIRRDLLAECLPFPVSDVHSDLALCARVLSRTQTVAFTDELVYLYHSNTGSILKSGRSRVASLDIVQQSVRESAEAVDAGILDTADWAYFTARFITLSRLKDALVGPYSPDESRQLARTARGSLGWSDLGLMIHRRDFRRAAMILSAKSSLGMHSLALSRTRRADSTHRGSAAAADAAQPVTADRVAS